MRTAAYMTLLVCLNVIKRVCNKEAVKYMFQLAMVLLSDSFRVK